MNSNKSISSAGKRKKKKNSAKNPSDSDSVDSFDSKEPFGSGDMDYIQEDRTQLDPYQQGPLEQEYKIQFHSDSEESENEISAGTTIESKA